MLVYIVTDLYFPGDQLIRNQIDISKFQFRLIRTGMVI